MRDVGSALMVGLAWVLATQSAFAAPCVNGENAAGSCTIPTGATSVLIEVWGGGGGAGAGHSYWGGGGGGGAYCKNTFASLTAGATLNVTVGGAGGAATYSRDSGGGGGYSQVSGTGVSGMAANGGGGGGGGTRYDETTPGVAGSGATLNAGGVEGAGATSAHPLGGGLTGRAGSTAPEVCSGTFTAGNNGTGRTGASAVATTVTPLPVGNPGAGGAGQADANTLFNATGTAGRVRMYFYPALSITYDANTATSGSVPVDNNTYQPGQTITVLANSGNLQRTNHTLLGWNAQADGNGATYLANGTATLVNGGSNVTLYAKWALNTYTVTPSAGANGSISPDTPQTINHGTPTSFTVTPNAGYSAGAAGTCGGSLVGTTYTTHPITGACTVIATFTGTDSTPDAFSFTPANGVALSTVRSSAISVSGINTAATVSVAGGEYSIDGGSYTSTPGMVNNGQSVVVRHTSSNSYNTAVTTTLSIGGVNGDFVSTTVPAPVNGACGSAHSTSLVTLAPSANLCSPGTASGITTNAANFAWTCAGANGGTTAHCSATRGYTVTPSAPANGSLSPHTPQVVAHSAQPTFTVTPNIGYAANVIGSCGGTLVGTDYTSAAVTADCTVAATFTGNDSTPNAFTFTAANGVALSTLQTTSPLTVAGITTAAAISITGGEYKINSGSFVSTPGTLNNGDTVTVRHTSSAAYSTAVTTTLTIGGVGADFVSTTLADPALTAPPSPPAPPAPPVPPPPAPTPVIESGTRADGTSSIYHIAPSAADSASPGFLRVFGSVVLQAQGNATSPHVQLTSQGTGPAEFGFVLDAQGRVMPRLLSGSAIVTATQNDVQPLMAWWSADAAAGVNVVHVITGQSCPTAAPSSVLITIDPTTQRTQLTVLSCGISVSGSPSGGGSGGGSARNTSPTPTNTATPLPLGSAYFVGETLTLNAQGHVTAVHLGSADGRGLVGDALPPRANTPSPFSNLSRLAPVPQLSGSVARVQRDLPTLLTETLAAHGYSQAVVSGDTGQVSAIVNGQRQSWVATGRISVNTPNPTTTPTPTVPAPSSVQPSAQGGLTVVAQGLQVALVPTAIDLEGLARVLHALGGTLQVQAHGGYLVTLNAQTLALHINPALTPRPTEEGTEMNDHPPVTASTQAPPAVLDVASQFFTQTLYPGVADWTAVQQLVAQAGAGSTASIQANGTINVTLNGQTFTLWPQMTLQATPANRTGQAFWLEGRTLFIALPHMPGFAQGLVVR